MIGGVPCKEVERRPQPSGPRPLRLRLRRTRSPLAGVTPRQIRDFSNVATSSNELLRVNPSRRYLLISPCRDEAQYLRRTLDSVAAQSVQPAAWVIVDDGSTDETPAILEEYARRLPYLRVVRRTDRGRREVGPGVVAAFYAGLKTVRLEDFDYLCKLDMDLDLPVRYFELLMQRMESDPRIGTTSGKPWFVHPQSGALGARNLRGRNVGRDDQVLSRRLFPGDRRLRAPGDVGRHRLPPGPHARLDRRERR